MWDVSLLKKENIETFQIENHIKIQRDESNSFENQEGWVHSICKVSQPLALTSNLSSSFAKLTSLNTLNIYKRIS